MEPCPNCGKPIADTAYLCTSCQDGLAQRLRIAASLWEHVQDTVGQRTRVEGTSHHSARQSPDRIGPTCAGMACEHPSCEAIWKTRSRWRREPPLAHEERGLIDLSASENAWIVKNTVDAWADHIAARRGAPVKPRPIGARQLSTVRDDARVERCIYSDLPIATCACGNPNRQHP